VTTARNRPRTAILTLALAAVGLAGHQGTTAAAQERPDGARDRVIVRAGIEQLSCALGQARNLGARVLSRQPNLGTFVATVRGDAVADLAVAPCVAAVTPDAKVRLSADSWSGLSATSNPADPGSLALQADLLGADDFWRAGYTGQGVGVALLDSGVAPVDGLLAPGKVVLGPDLSFESQHDATRNIDTMGHGTHMAGIIAGRDGAAAAPYTDAARFTGVAPDARLVSLKLADAHGATDVSQVIAAIDWVVQHRNDPGLNIRVLNLSFGTNTTQDYRLDPLSYAAEVAWNKGIVVVAAAGNAGYAKGRGAPGLTNPAYNPRVLAVGAVDNRGTLSTADDSVPSFSSSGPGGKGDRNPDLVAPGKSLVSLRVPGSYADVVAPGGRVGERFFRGSGTSQAAAFASGAAALLLSQRPGLTPDQVKRILTLSVSPVSEPFEAKGAGALNLSGALVEPTPLWYVQRATGSTGLGSLDAARGTSTLTLSGAALTGEKDIFGRTFVAAEHAAKAMAETAWTGGTWNGSTWAGQTWSGTGWWGQTWTGQTWSGQTWTGQTWSGQTWSGQTWSGQTWTGQTWTGQTWSGQTWSADRWSDDAWSSASWS
jgi:serine protease AprX